MRRISELCLVAPFFFAAIALGENHEIAFDPPVLTITRGVSSPTFNVNLKVQKTALAQFNSLDVVVGSDDGLDLLDFDFDSGLNGIFETIENPGPGIYLDDLKFSYLDLNFLENGVVLGQLQVDTTALPNGDYYLLIDWVRDQGRSKLLNTQSGSSDLVTGSAKVRIVDDSPVSTGMALIPAGEFLMGDSFNEGASYELPVHAVYVDAFYMDRYEVTNQKYAEALNWANAQGNLINVRYGVAYKDSGTSYPYCDANSADGDSRITWNGIAFGVVAGKENHPMVQVTWYGAVAYANWRSAMEGRVPSYDTGTWACNFATDGYRLPTEAEWEKAARGGASGRRFPWSDTDTIQHARANYYSYSWESYDTSPTRGDHPTFSTGASPYTSPVGYFAPNGYGLYDMAGNVWEWANDWYSSSYYGLNPSNNPRGPVSGTDRVLRGGSWGDGAYNLRCASRDGDGWPGARVNYVGFRLALDAEISSIWLLTPQSVSRESSSGTFGVAITMSTPAPWSAEVTPPVDWLHLTSLASGAGSAILWAQFDENTSPTSRTGTIRVTVPGASPTYRDVTITQAGTASESTVTHFEFAPIPGPYNVDDPIPVTITAVNANAATAAAQLQTGLNCDLRLTSNSGAPLSPNVGKLQKGIWKGSVTADQAYATTTIHASCLGLSGTSESFAVTSSQSATLTADVGTPGADVWLTKWNGTRIGPTGSGLRYYQFTGLEAGEYELCATVGEHFAARKQKLIVSAAPVGAAGSTEAFRLKWDVPLYDKRKPPVLFVPGFPGSTEGGIDYPNLTGPLLMRPYDALKLYGEQSAWRTLRNTLSSSFNVFDVPWDWRARIDGALVGTYLVPAINDVLNLCGESPWEKVDIVAHSTGGLVIREYIQNGYRDRSEQPHDYRGDINRFAMCGTPNLGAPVAWYIWDGGDPFRADNVAGYILGLFPFYEGTLANVYTGLTGEPFYERTTPSCYAAGPIFAQSCVPQKPRLSPPALRYWLQNEDPGLILPDLLPGKPILLGSNQSPSFPSGYQNTAWWRLNHGSNRNRMVDECGRGSSGVFDPEGVRTKLFLSTSEETVYRIPVGSPGDGLYLDGQPEGDPVKLPKYGDGTIVPYSKYQIGMPQISVEEPCTGTHCAEHVKLMSAYRHAIRDFLSGANCGPLIGPPLSARVGESESAETELQLSLRGRLQPFIIDPALNESGVVPGTNEVINDIPGSTLSIGINLSEAAILNPMPGEYYIELNGVPGHIFQSSIGSQQDERRESITVQGVFSEAPVSFRIFFDPVAEHTISVFPGLLPPIDVTAHGIQQGTRIAWIASSDPAAVEYNVYARPDDEPKYSLLGTTTDTHFDVPQAWSVAGSAPTWHYFVTAVDAEGNESFFTETVQNRHPLIASFSADATDGIEPLTVTFTDESAGEAMAWNWDFDSDGVIDSTEQNPVHEYAGPGSYTVTLTVGGPEGTDTTIRPGFITVHPTIEPPDPVPGDFDSDFAVTLADYAEFFARWSDPFADPTLAGWHLFDLDPDYDVDLHDFAHWQNLFGT